MKQTFPSPRSSDVKIPFHILWWIPAVVTLSVILMEFTLGAWSWGLMDDHGMVEISGGTWERFTKLTKSLWGSGRFPFTSMLHHAVFYKFFADSPRLFFVFRWVEVILAVGLWGGLAARVTRKYLAASLVFAVTLGFTKFYDAFFFLSSQEIHGILFSGAAAWLFFEAIKSRLEGEDKTRWRYAVCGLACLVLAFGSKEPFVAVGMALGVSVAGLGIFNRRLKGILALGPGLFFFSLGYALFLKLVLMKGYSARYGLTDWPKIWENIQVWFQQGFLQHVPWLVMAGMVLVFGKKQEPADIKLFWGRLLGVLLYFGYLLMILPWSGWGHYVTPLGVFFAFLITVFMAGRLAALPPLFSGVLIAVSLGMNLILGGSAIRFHSDYQYDTANLARWLAENVVFERETELGFVSGGNAMEPCQTIVQHVEFAHGKQYKPFVYTPQVKEILRNPRMKYYLWKTDGGDQDLRRLGNMWSPVFVSRSWVLFRRMY